MGRSGKEHQGIRGSAALATAPVAPHDVLAEWLEPGEMRRVPFAGDLLGAVKVCSRYAPIPLEVFDRAGERLRAEEQAAYLHLVRLSYGEGKNFCRLPMRDLRERLRLTERRLLRILDAVVAAGLVRPLHRNNLGTLWRVLLPREAEGHPLGDDILAGRASEVSSSRPPKTLPLKDRPPHTSLTGSTEVSLARELALSRGDESPLALEQAAQEVRELLAEGQSPKRISAALEAVRRRRLHAPSPNGKEP